MKFSTFRTVRVLFIVLLLALAVFPLGCVSSPQLTVTSIDHNQTYHQGFTQAYTRVDANGDTDVVLVDSATEKALDGHADSSKVRQIMHIRVVWEPTRDMKAVVSNATVNWYVIHQGQPQEVLEYSGIAFVSMDDGDDTVTLNVRNATLKPSAHHGNLTDPMGASRLEGTFVARTDSKRVAQVLNDLKVATAAASSTTPAVSSVDSSK